MEPVRKLSITMSPDMARALRESVEAGEYASTSEALRDAVRVWRRQRLEDAERLAAIKARIRRSLDDSRPALSAKELRDSLEGLFEEAREGAGRA